MELIIKPTSVCTFNCSFCSANLLRIKHNNHVSNNLKHIINTIKPDGLIVTGGDPLMMSPDYYKELLLLGDYNISLTTNLKEFYLNPDKWTETLLNPRISVCTSFQYGNERRWDKDTPYTEEMFIKVMNLFNEKIGYMPSFISVIGKNNEDKAIDHLLLAKRLGTKCKINPVIEMGLSTESYPKYKMIDIWLKIQELGLEDYWDMDVQFKKGGCGFNTNGMCESTIRAVYEDVNGNIHYSNCEDVLAYNDYQIKIDKEKPVCIKHNSSDFISEKCLTCELCQFCNNCKISRDVAKRDKNYCDEIMKRKDKILKSGWKI